jgi:hypothetical protein
LDNHLDPQPSQGLSATALSAVRDFIWDDLVRTADLAGSYARSLAEAAFRGDRRTAEVHIRQLRSCVVTAIQDFKDLVDDGGTT